MEISFFNIKNPWRSGGSVQPPAIRRTALDALPFWLSDDAVIVIYGARRVGKSTLLMAIVRELLTRQAVRPDRIFFFDLDTMSCADVLATPAALAGFIGPCSERTFVIIDEVQRLPNPGLFLKGVHDLGLPIKVFVSGSSSLELRSKVRESLVGRKRLVPLQGFDWKEYQTARGGDWRDYLVYGGYPSVVLASDPFEKRRLLLEFYESYVDRDIESFLRVDRMDVFRDLLRLLAFQTGGLVNLNELSATLRIGRDTLARYLHYLEETFVVRRLRPCARNPRTELVKMPKVYFTDCGWRNLVSAGFGAWPERQDRGALLESAVEHWLRDAFPLAEIGFWRTQAKAEVDFTVNDGGAWQAFEVKAQDLARPTISRSLRGFIAAHHPARATVVNLALQAEESVDGTPVRFVAFPECLQAGT